MGPTAKEKAHYGAFFVGLRASWLCKTFDTMIPKANAISSYYKEAVACRKGKTAPNPSKMLKSGTLALWPGAWVDG